MSRVALLAALETRLRVEALPAKRLAARPAGQGHRSLIVLRLGQERSGNSATRFQASSDVMRT